MGLLNGGSSKFFLKTGRDFKIPLIEFQHGDVSKLDMVSSYPKKIEGKYWNPNKIFLYGSYWKERYNLESQKIVIGNPVFDIFNKKYRNIKAKSNNVLCISVNSVSFARFVFEASKKDYSTKFYFKLRESEYDNWAINYPFLSNTKNFTIINNNHRHLYDLIGESSYIITTISTVIYESLSLKTNVIIIKNNDFPYIEELEKRGLIKTAETTDELINLINLDPDELKIDENLFYKPNSLKNLAFQINKIIK